MSGEQAQLERTLRARSEAVAEAWYQVVKTRSLSSRGASELRSELQELAEQAVENLFDPQVDRTEAEALGSHFVDFRLGPDEWARIVQLLTDRLTERLPLELMSTLQPRVTKLTSSMTAGFLRETEETVLKQQEQVRNAYVETLERTERELRIRDAAINSSVTAIALWELDGTITYVNPAFVAMWNYDTSDQMQGTNVQELWIEDEMSAAMERSLEQVGGWIGKLTGKRPDDSLFKVLISLSAVTDETGHPLRMMGSFVDMTYRERVREMLAQRVHRLEILHKIDQAILEARSPEEIMEVGLQDLKQLLPCTRASVLSCNFETQEIVVDAVQSEEETSIGVGTRFPMDGLQEEIEKLRQGQEILIEDITAYPHGAKGIEALKQEGFRSAAAIPIKTHGDLFGFLSLGAEIAGVLGRDCLPTAREVADSLAVAIQQARLHESTERQSERLRRMMSRLAEAEEAERRRVAQILHDRVGQNLTALGLNLNLIRSRLGEEAPPVILSRLDDSLVLIEETTERIRLVMTDLRPPMLDDYGLIATLRWYSDQFRSRTGIPVTIQAKRHAEANSFSRLPDHIERALFRITQEALTNAAKHAEASSVAIIVERHEDFTRLVISDDGVGFQENSDEAASRAYNLGLLTMAERAEAIGGRCYVRSEPHVGTRVVVEVER